MSANKPLLFLNLTNPPQESRRIGFKKEIRSFLAEQQHRKRNKQSKIADARSIAGQSVLGDEQWCIDLSEEVEAADTSAVAEDADLKPVISSRQVAHFHRRQRHRTRQNQNGADQAKEARRYIYPMHSEHPSADASNDGFSRYYTELPVLQHCLNDPTDDLNKSCKLLGQSVSDTLHLMYNLVDALGPDLERKLNVPQGLTAKYMIPMVLSDFALLAATTLKCATMICHLKGESYEPTAILEIRHFAISRIREALEEYPSRPISDEVLCAVSTLANFELVYNNDRELYNAHKVGLVKMIASRGGLQSLGKEGYVQSTLLYNDANTAKMAGCEPHLNVFRHFPTDVDPRFWLQGVSMPSEECADDSHPVEQRPVEEICVD